MAAGADGSGGQSFRSSDAEHDAFELWQKDRKVDTAEEPQPVSLAELTEAHQQIVIEKEETILKSNWTIAQSKRLIERIERLKAGRAAG